MLPRFEPCLRPPAGKPKRRPGGGAGRPPGGPAAWCLGSGCLEGQRPGGPGPVRRGASGPGGWAGRPVVGERRANPPHPVTDPGYQNSLDGGVKRGQVFLPGEGDEHGRAALPAKPEGPTAGYIAQTVADLIKQRLVGDAGTVKTRGRGETPPCQGSRWHNAPKNLFRKARRPALYKFPTGPRARNTTYRPDWKSTGSVQG